MRRHDLDPVAAVWGLLFLSAATVFLLVELAGLDVDGRWVLPVTLLLLGTAGLLTSLAPERRDVDRAPPRTEPSPAPPSVPAADPPFDPDAEDDLDRLIAAARHEHDATERTVVLPVDGEPAADGPAPRPAQQQSSEDDRP